MKKILCLLAAAAIFMPISADAAGFYFLPQNGEFYESGAFIAEMRFNSGGNMFNAVEAVIKFSPEEAQVEDFITGGSALDLWPQKPQIDNVSGTVKFSGGSTKGPLADNCLLGKLLVKPRRAGNLRLAYAATSRALLSDGQGTALDLDNLNSLYKISPKPPVLPEISSPSHPDSDKWNSNANLTLKWNMETGVQYSYILTWDPVISPDEIPENTIGEIEYFGLQDGIYYFHLRKKEADKDWSEKISRRIMIDAAPPEPFSLFIEKKSGFLDGKYFLSFNSQDATSGIDFFLVCETGKTCQRASSPYVLKNQWLGKEIAVRAFDKAGNMREMKIITTRAIPFYIWIFAGLPFLAAIIFFIFYTKRKNKNEKKINSFPLE